jgi:hypothetical protein
VDPEAVMWRPRTLSAGFPDKRRRRYALEEREALRAASDRQARADQARQVVTRPGPPRTEALQRAARTPRPGAGATTARSPRTVADPSATTVSAISADPALATAAAPEAQQPAHSLAAELDAARQRIAALEAELERHRTVERDILRRIDHVTRRRAA